MGILDFLFRRGGDASETEGAARMVEAAGATIDPDDEEGWRRLSGDADRDLRDLDRQADRTGRSLHDLAEEEKVCACGCALTLQRNLFLETFQFHLLSPVRKVRPMVSLLGPSNKPNHHFNIKGPHRQDCS